MLRALEQPSEARRLAIETLCRAHPTLADSIRRLADSSTQRWPSTAVTPEPGFAAGGWIGPFRLLDELGSGGMGTVFLAEQREPVFRRVAIKVVKLGMDSRSVLARFEVERQALALMDHPHIARVIDAGITDRGQPWFAMECVKGEPLNRYCDAQRLTLEERLGLFRQVCAGVQHAHGKGVIHRDLTPNNVLVALQDGVPVAKIIDFGLARAIDRPLTAGTVITERGMILGTPAYMSPEQAGIGPLDLDIRADVYTLGVLLFELVAGMLPFERAEFERAGLDGMCLLIRETDPPTPSAKLTRALATATEAARCRRTDRTSLVRRLQGDLDAIVMKCLEKDRVRRYETVSQLADDVQRFLHNEPVRARAAGARYRAQKFVQRHRAGVAVAVGFVLLLVAGLAGTTHFMFAAQRGEADLRAQSHALLAASELNAALALRHRLDTTLRAGASLTASGTRHLADLTAWLEVADALLAQRPLLDAALAKLPGERTVDRDAPPTELRLWERRDAAVAAARAARRDGKPVPVPALSAAQRLQSVAQLNDQAWARVAPDDRVVRPASTSDRSVIGEEALGLAYALAARAKDQEARDPNIARHDLLDTLAWALFAVGRDAEALQRAQEALAIAPPDQAPVFTAALAQLRDRIATVDETEHGVETALRAARARAASLARLELPSSPRFHDIVATHARREALLEIRRDLDAFERRERHDVATQIGWLERVTALADSRFKEVWRSAAAAIATADGRTAHTAYAGARIELSPRPGLVPIGMNPATRLWEFYDLRSAWDPRSGRDPADLPIPTHAPDGSLPVTDDLGIVLVLLPGGRFTMGAQRLDDTQPGFDRDAMDDEQARQVEVAPFFIARYETTQAQWRRLTGRNPSLLRAGDTIGPRVVTATHPVENVTWLDARRALARAGLGLPDEAEWEYAARGGTTAPWYTGDVPEALALAANLADATAHAVLGVTSVEAWRDGFATHGPVGSLQANPFGLHDVIGNVWEWCGNSYRDPRFAPDQTRDGVARADGAGRGGAYDCLAKHARVSYRNRAEFEARGGALGVRATLSWTRP